MIVTTGASLLVACACFVVYDTMTGRKHLAAESALLGRVLGINSAVALTFGDATAATETLAGLEAADLVVAAVIYDAAGATFASYAPASVEAGGFRAPPPELPGHRFANGSLHVFQPILLRGEEIGTIYLQLDASGLTARLWWYAAIGGLLIVAAALLAGAVSARLRRQISSPLAALLDSARAIAAGDLTRHVPVTTSDELGILAKTFNEMTAGLCNLVDQVGQSTGEVTGVSRGLEERGARLLGEAQRQREATSQVGNAVAQVLDSVRSVNDSVEQLAGTSQETSVSILEMDASIGEIASHMDELSGAIDTASASMTQLTANIDQVVGSVETLQAAADVSAERVQELSGSVTQIGSNAAESHALSEDSSREASEGMDAVNETIDAMGEIASSFGHLQERVSHLSETSQSIDDIVEVITGVAEQTGLLSLNAAIIAAQAGEHGKAFSVVAEQVSTLADRSHRSAREIAELIDAIQEDTAAAVSAVAEGSSKVERGVQRSEMAGKVLSQIIDKTASSTHRVSEIVEAAERQSQDLRRVARAVSEVQEIVAQIDQAAREQNGATKEIAKVVQSIRKLGTAVRSSTAEQRRGSGLITEAASNVAEMATQIAESTHSQQSSGEAIQRALQVFTDVVAETSRGAETIATSVAALSERAQHLEEELGRFKTR